MSSVSTTLLGRRFWTSVWESGESWSVRGSFRHPPNPRANRQPAFASQPALRRSIHTERHSAQFPRQNGHNAKRSFTSSGLLLIGFSTGPSSSTSSVVATCTAAADSAVTGSLSQKPNIYNIARQAWRRSMHTQSRPMGSGGTRRHLSSKPPGELEKKAASPQARQDAPKTTEPVNPQPTEPELESITSSVSKYLNLPHLPKMPHRPTREELLAAANGFWERLKVRFKWASIRSMRPWNIDEWGAFVSWFLFGHLVWVLVGTTTFFSLLIFSINTVFAQETLAKWVGDYLTKSAGVTVLFESAIVPRWGDGVISFRNVFVSRRPGQVRSSVSKGSSSNAAAAAAAGRHVDQDGKDVEEDDGNYTQYDLTIANVNVTLSFLKWWNGKGLLKDVEVQGVRGVVDRTSVNWTSEGIDPKSYRHSHQPGDFEIDSFKLEDLLVTVHQTKNFRPFSVSIYSCELPQLRKQWLFYDLLSANHMSGSFDGSLFTIHPRQVHGTVAGDNRDLTKNAGEPAAWKKFSRLRIDGLKIDHLNRGVDGPFGWIYEGNVDIVADVMFPADADDGIAKVMSDFYDQLEEVVIENRIRLLNKDRSQEDLAPSPSAGHISQASTEPAADTAQATTEPVDDDRRFLIMDMRTHLNDVKAAVPLFTHDISYINQALVRPIVAYINAKKTYIPITCRIVKRASDFDGSWTVFDSGLMNDLSAETYEAFARDVEDQQSRVRRLRKVGFWTLSLAVHALFMGMAGNVV